MLHLKCIFYPCNAPEMKPRALFALHYNEIQTGLNDYKWLLFVLAPTCIRFRLKNLSEEITWDKMDISKLQACNSSGSVYQFSVSSKLAVEKIVGSDNKRLKTFTFKSQILLALILSEIKNPDQDQLHLANE